MITVDNEKLWCEKYRPQRISDCILPQRLKDSFQGYVDSGHIPNLLLTGGPGMGKTTVARAMLEELDVDYLMINASMYGNIDTLRTEIQRFASAMSMTGGQKYVLLDEADYLNPNSTQPALRNFMEEYSSTCGFILTGNLKNRIIPALQSRTANIDFRISKKELPTIAKEFFKRSTEILKNEGIQYDKQVLLELIKKYHPDWRKTINELQRYSVSGTIDVGILSDLTDDSFKSLVKYLSEKNFTEVRKWVAENSDIDTETLYRKLYDHSVAKLSPSDVAQVVVVLGEYQYKAAFVANSEINNVACLVEIMGSVSFK
jgi:DNA polymerase III delta prime subunit